MNTYKKDYESNMSQTSNYFSCKTVGNLKLHQVMSARHQCRAIDVTLACKLTLAYGKYHLMMQHRYLAISTEPQISYHQAEVMADVMNKMTVIHSSPTDFLQTQEESTDESIENYREYKKCVEAFADDYFVPSVVERFCKVVYDDEDKYYFFKAFCNLYYSLYADVLLSYQAGEMDYATFCDQFQELSWGDGHKTPLDATRLKRYIAAMREVVELYKSL